MTKKKAATQVISGRHETQCSICQHAEREAIEREFVGWGSPVRISTEYGTSRDAIYRHAHAARLFEKRQRNVRAALERIIEKAADVDVNGATVVAAVGTYARLNTYGQLVERSQNVDMNKLFERMTNDEMKAYAERGQLPEWFSETVGATG